MEELEKSDSTPDRMVFIQATGCELVDNVTEAMMDLLQNTECPSIPLEVTQCDLHISGCSLEPCIDAAEERVCSTALKIFNNIQKKVSESFHRQETSDKNVKTTKASARMVISQAIVSIKNSLPDPEGAEKSEELHLAHNILGTMLDEVKMMDCQAGSETSSDYLKPSGFDCQTTP